MRTYLTALVLLFASISAAQEVREESPAGLSSTAYRKAAEKAGTYWPNYKEGDTGTQVRVSFDARNADVVVVTEKSFGNERLLKVLQSLAQELDMPEGDFITYPTSEISTSVAVDLEMNDYLVFPDRWKTIFGLPVGKVIDFLKRNGLPQPIAIAIKGSEVDSAILSVNGKSTTIEDRSFFTSENLPEGATVQFSDTLSPSGYVVLGIVLLIVSGLVSMPFRIAKSITKNANKPKPEEIAQPTPEQIQEAYDKSKSSYWHVLFFLPVIALPLVIENPVGEKAARSMYFLAPKNFFLFVGMGLFAGLSTGFIAAHRAKKKSESLEQTSTREAEPKSEANSNPFKSMWPMFVAMLLMFGTLILVQNWPGFYRLNIPSWAMRTWTFGLIGLGLLESGYLSWCQRRSNRKVLEPGDPWFEMTSQLAERAGVRLYRVVIVKNPAANAYANLIGEVGLTTGLIENLSPEEVEAILAHELGHHRLNDVRKGFLLSLLFLVAWFLFLNYPIEWLADKYQWSRGVRGLVRGPLVFFFLLPILQNLVLGKYSRKRELRADAFGAWLINDKEQMIRALNKITHLNQSPSRLKPSDEVLRSHPSLLNRIKSLENLNLESFNPDTYSTEAK